MRIPKLSHQEQTGLFQEMIALFQLPGSLIPKGLTVLNLERRYNNNGIVFVAKDMTTNEFYVFHLYQEADNLVYKERNPIDLSCKFANTEPNMKFWSLFSKIIYRLLDEDEPS